MDVRVDMDLAANLELGISVDLDGHSIFASNSHPQQIQQHVRVLLGNEGNRTQERRLGVDRRDPFSIGFIRSVFDATFPSPCCSGVRVMARATLINEPAASHLGTVTKGALTLAMLGGLGRAVIALADETARRLFPYENPIGRAIWVGSEFYTVIGQTKDRTASAAIGGSLDSRDYNLDAYIPLKTLRQRVGDLVMRRVGGGQGFNFTGEDVELFESLNQSGQTIVMITHEDEVAARAKRVIRLRDGIIESDTVNQP